MKFTVVWWPRVQQHLASVWIASGDRKAVTLAADTIDALLVHDPQTLGEVRFDTVRTLMFPPLGVEFEVNEEDRVVHVPSVWDLTKG